MTSISRTNAVFTSLVILTLTCGGAPREVQVLSRIEGVVLDSVTGNPISGVEVRKPIPPPPPDAPPPPPDDTSVPPGREPIYTNSAGQFVLEDIRVVTGRIDFRHSGFRDAFPQFTFVPGASLLNIVIKMEPLGIVSGRVFGADGKPAIGIAVTPYRWQVSNSRTVRVLFRDRSTYTDDRGEFRFYELIPGRYVIGYGPKGHPQGWSVLDPAMPVPVLYPNVGDAAAAEIIEVKGHEEIRLKDMLLGSTRLGVVRLHLVNGIGETAKDVEVSLSESLGGALPPAANVGRGPQPTTRPKDSELPEKPVRARVEGGGDLLTTFWPNEPVPFVAKVSWTDSNGVRLSSTTSVPFRGADIDVNVDLKTPKGHLDIRGFKELSDGTVVPLSGAAIGLCARKMACLSSWVFIQSQDRNNPDPDNRPRLDSNGKLRIANIPEDTFDVYSLDAGEGFYFVSARQGNRDALFDGVAVTDDAPVLEVRVQAGPGKLRGRAVNSAGQAEAHAIVRLLPETPLDRTRFGAIRREIRADQDGYFEFSGLIPGKYRAYTWPADHNDGWSGGYDDRYIDSELVATGNGKAVSVERGSESSVDLVLLNRR